MEFAEKDREKLSYLPLKEVEKHVDTLFENQIKDLVYRIKEDFLNEEDISFHLSTIIYTIAWFDGFYTGKTGSVRIDWIKNKLSKIDSLMNEIANFPQATKEDQPST